MMPRYLNILKTIVKAKIGLPVYPSFCTYFVTWRCNGRCLMCDVWKKDRGREMGPAEARKAFSGFKRLDGLRISGGEPFMREDLPELLAAVKRETDPSVVHITTNGLLRERVLSFAEGINDGPRTHIKVSISAMGEKYDEIMGIQGGFKTVEGTLKGLASARGKRRFYLGVNQTIVDDESLRQYVELKKMCVALGVDLLPVFAYKKAALYNLDQKSTMPAADEVIDTFSEFSEGLLKDFFAKVEKDIKKISDLPERLVKRYYIKGLRNRLLRKKRSPHPPCAALSSHIRVLPDGDIPLCLHNPAAAGNLLQDGLKAVWSGEGAERLRKTVKSCPGCWAGCEVIPSAIYSGDLLTAFL